LLLKDAMLEVGAILLEVPLLLDGVILLKEVLIPNEVLLVLEKVLVFEVVVLPILGELFVLNNNKEPLVIEEDTELLRPEDELLVEEVLVLVKLPRVIVL
jgi:hypothetical protein